MAISVSTDIYLDANATTRVLPTAADEATAAMEELFGNPSSSHITGIKARHILEATRNLVRSVLGAESGQIIFTRGATEAIQMGVNNETGVIHDLQAIEQTLRKCDEQVPWLVDCARRDGVATLA